jgi:hypothetical protein
MRMGLLNIAWATNNPPIDSASSFTINGIANWPEVDGNPAILIINSVPCLSAFYREQQSLHQVVLHFAGASAAHYDWTSATNGQDIASDPCAVLVNQLGLNVFAIDPTGDLILFVGDPLGDPPLVYNLSDIAPGANAVTLTGSPRAALLDQSTLL